MVYKVSGANKNSIKLMRHILVMWVVSKGLSIVGVDI